MNTFFVSELFVHLFFWTMFWMWMHCVVNCESFCFCFLGWWWGWFFFFFSPPSWLVWEKALSWESFWRMFQLWRFQNSVCRNVVLTRRGGGGGGGEGGEGAGWNSMCLYIIFITWVSSSSLGLWCCTVLCAVAVIRPWYMLFKAVWRLFLMGFCLGLFVVSGLLDVGCFAL